MTLLSLQIVTMLDEPGATLKQSEGSITLNGRELKCSKTTFLGAFLLQASRETIAIPPPDALPYLFCGNGACRDCNLAIDGLDDLPACRLPPADGLSIRTGDGAGASNALSRKLGPPPRGRPVTCRLLVVGGGPVGCAAAEAAGIEDILQLDARRQTLERVRSPCPVAVTEEGLGFFDEGRLRPIRAEAILLATGAHDVVSVFPGSTLPGCLPMDLAERYLSSGNLPGSRFVVQGDERRAKAMRSRLRRLGASVALVPPRWRLVALHGETRVERAELVENEGGDRRRFLGGDTAILAGRRHPSLALAKAMGCRTRYDRARNVERLVLDDRGMTTRDGVFVAGDAAGIQPSLVAACEDGRRVGEAAARRLRAKDG